MSTEAVSAAPAATVAAERPVKEIRKTMTNPFITAAVIVLTVLWTIPTFGLLVSSVRPARDVVNSGWWTFFEHPHFTLSNYHDVLFNSGFGGSGGLFPFVVNSIAITIPGTLIPITIAAMGAYALAWVRFRGSDTIFFTVFALQVVPLQMALIPLLRLYKHGAHIGSLQVLPALPKGYYSVWISHTMFGLPLAIFLLHNFISRLPNDLMEAAKIDGASHFRIFRTIVLPLSTPALASLAIFQFLWVWNDLLVAITFAGGGNSVLPLTGRLAQLNGSLGAHPELLTAGAFIAMVLPLVVFFSLQRYFVRGLLAGSVKG
ncbi:MAG: alpha-glucoside transport system permease protein [Actinomycetota bacterium]|jgi:alpha-glucoside transport system permease protein|nr:alpha-glucoside transport system permease protein [Actinomycetota bacterium]MDQ1541815.1 alpha-glucoside transport system permease protein [Actinomycetota bacterium]